MNRVVRELLAPVVVTAAILGGLTACGGDQGDVKAFCAAVDDLKAHDPFAGLEVASPGEMRAAFDQLAAGVDQVSSSAPSAARVQARAYRDAVRELIDQLRGADFDPRAVDALAYRKAVADYQDAAVSVDNAATSLCP